MGNPQTAKAADGTRIVFETRGDRSNPAIFMGPHFYVTRSPDDGSFTDRWIEALEQDFFLIVADYPRVAGPIFNPDIAVREYGLIADAAGIGRFGWLGYSYGGAIGVQLACRTDRIAALAVGGFPPLNAPFTFMYEFLTRMALAPPQQLRSVDPRKLSMDAAFYRALLRWPERQEIGKLTMPRMTFMGDLDTAQGMPAPWSVPLADCLRAVEQELRALGWRVAWLAQEDHLTALRPEVSLPLVRQFFRESLLDRNKHYTP